MSMFDNRLYERISHWADRWGSPQRIFKDKVSVSASSDMTQVFLRLHNGDKTEFMRLTPEDWESGVRTPAVQSKCANTNGALFFLYHWMEERNMLTNLFNQLEESRNA